jgi:putative DNA primase/helicase
MPAAAQPVGFSKPSTTRDGGLSPGDDYNNRADWADILQPAGWRLVWARGRERGWRRPGKTDIGISATTGYGEGDWLYVFSTSTEFQTETTYTKFAAYAQLNFNGDYSAAASALRASGYGSDPQPEPRPVAESPAAIPPARVIDEPPVYHRTDDSNALRLVDGYADRIRYVPQRGSWLAWNGHRWLWDEAGVIHEHARSIARTLPGDLDRRDSDSNHKRNSLSARGLRAMVTIASTDPRISTPLTRLDANPWQLNTPGGTVDLRTGRLLPPDPAALHTRSTAVTPDHDQTPRRWLDFLADTFAGEEELTGYVQRLLGLSLVGQVLEQLLPFAYGEGANGKTTLLGVVQRLLGLGDTGYSISAPSELLLATSATGHPTELARLAGARLVVTSELDDGQRFAEARVKLLTGRDTIAARFMRRDFFDFTPTHTLWLLGNHQPTVRAGGPALWRRLRLIPFLHTVPPEKRISDLEDRLADEEGPGILAWIIQGLT